MADEPLFRVAADVGRHLLVAIDDAIQTDATPSDLKLLADAFGQVASHLPKGHQYQQTK